ncbi:hypothetical protein JCM10908_002272 [Rhodotorula pacifica]|uniref:F-box protein n=1 Tax=Rhodotorula pacifica TaxID=1495444 RepID=UPI00317702CF
MHLFGHHFKPHMPSFGGCMPGRHRLHSNAASPERPPVIARGCIPSKEPGLSDDDNPATDNPTTDQPLADPAVGSAPEAPAKFPFKAMPYELKEEVVQKLSASDLAEFKRVSKECNELATREKSDWTRFQEGPGSGELPAVGVTVYWHPFLDKLDCTGASLDPRGAGITPLPLWRENLSANPDGTRYLGDAITHRSPLDFQAINDQATFPACTAMVLDMEGHPLPKITNNGGIRVYDVSDRALAYWSLPYGSRGRLIDTIEPARKFDGWAHATVESDADGKYVRLVASRSSTERRSTSFGKSMHAAIGRRGMDGEDACFP